MLLPLNRLLTFLSFENDRSRDGHVWIEIGLGHADVRGLGGRLALGDADVGSSPQEIGGNSDDRLGGRLRNLSRVAEHRQQVVRRHAQEDAQPVLRLAAVDFEDGDERFRDGEIGLGPLHVEFRDQPFAVAEFDELESLLLQIDVLLRQGDALFQGAHLDVVCGDLRLEHDHALVIAGDLGVQRRRRPPRPRGGTVPKCPVPTRRRIQPANRRS